MMEIVRPEENKKTNFGIRRPSTKAPKTAFHTSKNAPITPVDYLRRLARYSFCSRSVFLAAFYYLNKATSVQDNSIQLNLSTIHRLLITAVLLATKFIDDVHYDNSHFAKVGGLDVRELNALELQLLKQLDFKLHINSEEFANFEFQVVDVALTTRISGYSALPDQLQNFGYDSKRRWTELEPPSPTSTMNVSFDTPSKVRRG